MGIKVGKMLSFECSDCKTVRPYGEANSFIEKPVNYEPLIQCSVCKSVKPHRFTAVEGYQMSYTRAATGAIVDCKFSKVA